MSIYAMYLVFLHLFNSVFPSNSYKIISFINNNIYYKKLIFMKSNLLSLHIYSIQFYYFDVTPNIMNETKVNNEEITKQ